MKTLRKVLSIVFLSVAALLFFSGAFFAAVTKDAVLNDDKLSLSNDEISVFDCNDEVVKTTALGDKKRLFSVEKIPQPRSYDWGGDFLGYIVTNFFRFFSGRGLVNES